MSTMRPFGGDSGLPQFSKEGTALSAEMQKEHARKRGICWSCGVKTHNVTPFRRTGLTNQDVYDGHCIKCDPDEVPVKAYAEWERRNPLIAAQKNTLIRKHRSKPPNSSSMGASAHSGNRRYDASEHSTARASNHHGIRRRDTGEHSTQSTSSASNHNRTRRCNNTGGERSLSPLPATRNQARKAPTNLLSMNSVSSSTLSDDSFCLEQVPASIDVMSNSSTSSHQAAGEGLYWESTKCSEYNGPTASIMENKISEPVPEDDPLESSSSNSKMVAMLSAENVAEWLDEQASEVRDAKKNPKKVDAVGIVVAVVAALGLQTEDPAVQRSGCRALCYTAIGNASVVVSEGGLGALTAAMSRQSTNASVQQYGCGALLNMSVKAKLHTSVVSQGAIEAVLAAMKHHPGDVKVHRLAVGALKNFTLSEEGKNKIATSGTIKAIITSAMKVHAADSEIQLLAIGALKNLAVRDDLRKKIAGKSGISAILAAMKRLSKDAAIQQEACSALLNLSLSKENRASVGQEGIPTILDTMKRHNNDANVVSSACSLLWNLSANKANHGSISSNDGIQIVVRCMQKGCPKSVEVQEKACLLLANMSTLDTCRVSVLECGGILAAIEGMRRFPRNGPVQKYACKLLANVSSREDCKDAITQNGGFEAAGTALKLHREGVHKYAKILGISG